jgi:hypothetical protein
MSLPKIAQLQFDREELSTVTVSQNINNTTFDWDFEIGDFAKKDGRLVKVTGNDALKIWIQKVIRTELDRFEIYTGTNYGIHFEELVGNVYPYAFVESELKREIIEALKAHPKINGISYFTFEKDGSLLNLSFKVELSDSSSISQEVTFSV